LVPQQEVRLAFMGLGQLSDLLEVCTYKITRKIEGTRITKMVAKRPR
jgi:hypothetical protein